MPLGGWNPATTRGNVSCVRGNVCVCGVCACVSYKQSFQQAVQQASNPTSSPTSKQSNKLCSLCVCVVCVCVSYKQSNKQPNKQAIQQAMSLVCVCVCVCVCVVCVYARGVDLLTDNRQNASCVRGVCACVSYKQSNKQPNKQAIQQAMSLVCVCVCVCVCVVCVYARGADLLTDNRQNRQQVTDNRRPSTIGIESIKPLGGC